jgi:hypothetical protein
MAFDSPPGRWICPWPQTHQRNMGFCAIVSNASFLSYLAGLVRFWQEGPGGSHSLRLSAETRPRIMSRVTGWRHFGSGQKSSPNRPPRIATSNVAFKQGLQTCRSWSHLAVGGYTPSFDSSSIATSSQWITHSYTFHSFTKVRNLLSHTVSQNTAGTLVARDLCTF